MKHVNEQTNTLLSRNKHKCRQRAKSSEFQQLIKHLGHTQIRILIAKKNVIFNVNYG